MSPELFDRFEHIETNFGGSYSRRFELFPAGFLVHYETLSRPIAPAAQAAAFFENLWLRSLAKIAGKNGAVGFNHRRRHHCQSVEFADQGFPASRERT